MNNLFVFLPCYNEEKNIGALIDNWLSQEEKIKKEGYNLKIFPIDDCSTDNTKKIIESKEIDNSGLIQLIVHEHNKNLRGGLNTSISQFLKIGNTGDIMCLMDGDNTHSPHYISEMIKTLRESDVDCVIASRYCKNSNVVGLSPIRKFMSDMARVYYTIVLRVPNVKDYTCGYRVYQWDIIDKLVSKFGTNPIKEKSFACMMELLYKIYLSGARFAEVGFELRYDFKQGESKMNVGNTMINSLKAALLLRKLRKEG